jgi:hypothetical protein
MEVIFLASLLKNFLVHLQCQCKQLILYAFDSRKLCSKSAEDIPNIEVRPFDHQISFVGIEGKFLHIFLSPHSLSPDHV